MQTRLRHSAASGRTVATVFNGTAGAWQSRMAYKLEEMSVYLKACEFSIAVTAIIDRPAFGRNRKLKDQIADANESILSNMAEGFEQSTDAAVANYLYLAKGSVAEVVTRLKSAHRRGWLTAEESAKFSAEGDEIGRMLGGWIKYLARCDWKDRGRFRARQQGKNPDGSS